MHKHPASEEEPALLLLSGLKEHRYMFSLITKETRTVLSTTYTGYLLLLYLARDALRDRPYSDLLEAAHTPGARDTALSRLRRDVKPSVCKVVLTGGGKGGKPAKYRIGRHVQVDHDDEFQHCREFFPPGLIDEIIELVRKRKENG
jgi:hypothetical protein